MHIPRIRFVVCFLIFAVAFILGTAFLLDQSPQSFFGSASQSAWQYVVSTIVSPIKIVLVGPLIPFIKFLHQDPDTPPPFFLIGFTCYWAILGLVLHFLLSKRKQYRRTKSSLN